ncbi:MAG: hypothetical protein J0H15_10485 [Xanthomonadales bacterium]|nr:hypothetical protein [Xanthomonadales bacterium]
MPAYQPPFQLTHRMTTLVADIAERLGAWKAANRGALVPALRRGNRMRTLQVSLPIEQNTLSLEQVTTLPPESGTGLSSDDPGGPEGLRSEDDGALAATQPLGSGGSS